MKRFALLFALLIGALARPGLLAAASISGQTAATNSPLTSPVAGVGSATAIPAVLASSSSAPFTASQVNTALTAVLANQGFTAGNNWVYSFNGLPSPLSNPVGVGNFNITTYNLYMNGAQTGFGETMKFTLADLPTPVVPQGAAVKAHWLQLIDESQMEAGKYGSQVNGLNGYWALDNGFVNLDNMHPTAAPFYDSNKGPSIFPPSFEDDPQYFSAPSGTTYLYFVTIPTWDVSYNGKDYLLVGTGAVEWGMTLAAPAPAPEPSSILLACLGGGLLLAVARKQRGHALPDAA